MDLLLNATTRAVGRTVPGAPPSDDQRRRFNAHTSPPRPHLRWSTGDAVFRVPTSPHVVGAGFHARPASVDGRRYYAAPTLHQPLSHAAKRRDSSPFRGAEGREGISTFAHLFPTMPIPWFSSRP